MNRRRACKQARGGPSAGQSAQAQPRRRWRFGALLLSAVLCLVVAVGLGYLGWVLRDGSGRRATLETGGPRLTLGEPPVDAAGVLRLPRELPQTVEAMNEEALAVGRLLVESLPDRPEAHGQMAFAHLQVGQDRPALESWQKALEKDPTFADAHLGMGAILKELGENEQAIAAFRKAVELNPEMDAAYRELAEVLLRERKAEEALSVARECARRFPAVPEHHFWVGQAHLQLEDYAEARRHHEEAIRIDPDFTLSYHPLAIACARLGQNEEAKRYQERFAVLKAAELEADRNRARVYDDRATQRHALVKRHVLAGVLQLQVGDPRLAEAHWLRAAAIAPDDVATRKALANLYEQQARAGAALRLLDELIPIEPDNPEHLLRKGRLLVGLGSEPEGKQILERVLQMAPRTAEAHLLLAQMHLRAGSDVQAAASHAETAVSLAPSPQSLLVLAAVRGECGDRAGALSALRQAVSLDPDNPEIRRAYEQLRAAE